LRTKYHACADDATHAYLGWDEAGVPMVTPVIVIVFVAGVVVAGIIVAGIASTPTSSNRRSCCSMTADRCGEPIPAANDCCSKLGQAAECLEALAEKSSSKSSSPIAILQ
jgi:hypothetical protein